MNMVTVNVPGYLYENKAHFKLFSAHNAVGNLVFCSSGLVTSVGLSKNYIIMLSLETLFYRPYVVQGCLLKKKTCNLMPVERLVLGMYFGIS